jgi:hypothetical protein
MRALTPAELVALAKLLTTATTFDSLQRMVYLGTGDQLYEQYVGPGRPLRPTIEDLLKELEKLGITEKFLAVVYRELPFRADVRSAIAALHPRIDGQAAQAPLVFQVQDGGVAQPSEPGVGPGLQRNVRPRLKQVDLRVWLDRVEAIERQICRVEADGQAIGTGFLVGPSAVLTNWHVVDEARQRGKLAQLACRFDYRRLSNNTLDPGKLIAVTKVTDERPCSDAERTATPDDPPPQAGELDYALLELGAAAGTERGFTKLDGAPIAANDPLIIVQHPTGEPAKFAVDTGSVIGLIHAGQRLRYRTNTEAGSSGSPCFTMDMDLIALHHLGDPRVRDPLFNQGIPIALVKDSIVARGHGAALSA